MSEASVAVLMGSDSDLPTMQAMRDVLQDFDIPFEVKVTSAHRTPAATPSYVTDADRRGCAVFTAAAGMTAHLAGTVAGLTLKPVVGVPIDAGPLKGMDALLSTVQMPGGIPVASVAIGKAGAKNAGYLAAQNLSTAAPTLRERLGAGRQRDAEAIVEKDARLQECLKAET